MFVNNLFHLCTETLTNSLKFVEKTEYFEQLYLYEIKSRIFMLSNKYA